MKNLKFVLRYLKKHWLAYSAGILTLFIVDFANIYIPKFTGFITDGLTDQTFGMPEVLHYLLLILLVSATIALGRFFWRFFLFGTARKIEKEMRDDLFAHLETLSVNFFHTHKIGDLMTRFTSDLNAIRMAIGMAVISLFDAVVMSAMVLFQMVFYVDLKLTLLVLIPMAVIALGEIYYGKLIKPRYLARQEALSDLTDYVQESFSGVRVIKAFVRERSQVRAFLRSNGNTMQKSLRVILLQTIFMPLLDVVIGFGSLITLVYGGYLTLTGGISLGRFVAFNQYINMLIWPMMACGEAINLFSQGAASAARVRETLETEPEIRDLAEGTAEALMSDSDLLSGASASPSFRPLTSISVRELTFTYPGQTFPALRNISLEIPAGTTLAVIGRTGSGKSTLASLLLHMYQIPEGMLFFDRRDINDIPLKALRGSIAYVPQENFLFSDTLANNIAFGADQEDRAAIEEAAKTACIHDNILSFPEKYETVVGERGVTLSGGQKQRSSIARALMKNAPILILDDSLSAVDTDTERQLLQNLRKNRAGKTTIIIAHRISTIQHADKILVLENGQAAEYGNHEELLALGGIYRDMFEKQQLEAAIGEMGGMNA